MEKNRINNWDIFWRIYKASWLADHIHNKNFALVDRTLSGHKLNLPADSKIVEFGCGAGRSLKILKRYFPNAIGIDNSETALEICKSNDLRRGTDIIKMNCFDPDLPREYFNLVFSEGLLEHFPPFFMQKLVHEMCRVSKKYVMLLQPSPIFSIIQSIYCRVLSQPRMEEHTLQIRDCTNLFQEQGFSLFLKEWGYFSTAYLVVFQRDEK